MKARNWGSLKEATRRRYERNGVTRETYESGADLRSARGHAATPERPERAVKNPERYASYLTRNASRLTVHLVTTNGLQKVYVPAFRDRSTAGKYWNQVNRIVNDGAAVPPELAGATVGGYLKYDDGSYDEVKRTFVLEPDKRRVVGHVMKAADDGFVAFDLYSDKAV